MTEFLGAVLVVIIFALLDSLFEYIKQKHFEKSLIDPDEFELIENDDEINIYIDFFNKNIGKPFGKCRIPRKILEQLKNSYDDISTIQTTMSVLLKHIGLSQSYIVIKINQSNNASAGEYTNINIPQITVNLKEGFTYINILAILCHECTHHFMRIHNIHGRDTMDNEKMTDALAIYLGFDKYIELGYMAIKRIKGKSYISTNNGTAIRYDIQTSTIGYLNVSRINDTIRKVNQLRKKYFLFYIWNKVNFVKKYSNILKK